MSHGLSAKNVASGQFSAANIPFLTLGLLLTYFFKFLSYDFQIKWLRQQRRLKIQAKRRTKHPLLVSVSTNFYSIINVKIQGIIVSTAVTILKQVMEEKLMLSRKPL